jgi:FkbM family methyltransferase
MSWMTPLNRAIGPMLANNTTGRWIARWFGDRIPHRGLVVDTSHPLIKDNIKAALFFRGYESGEYRFVRRYVPANIDVVELGGSMGIISCTIRRNMDANHRLIVVEADPRLADVLERNLAINGCSDGVFVERKAISYSGEATVSFAQGETSVSGRLSQGGNDEVSITVPATTLAKLIGDHGLTDYALVSDIEGVEWNMINNDLDAMAKARVIVIETHADDPSIDVAALIAKLKMAGKFDIVAEHGPVIVFSRPKERSH